MKTRLIAVGVMVAVLGAMIPASPAQAAVTRRVTGTCQIPGVTGTGEFTGRLTIEQVVVEGGQLVAQGRLVGRCVVETATGTVTQTVNQTVSIPITGIRVPGASQGVCEVLILTLGPVHLELLGLIVDLNRVVLRITADPSGGILGELLCSLAGGGLTLNQIAAILNQILAQL
jgi:hypothetical protein